MKVCVVINPTKVDDLHALRTAVERAFPAAELAWLETTADDPGRGQAQHALDDGCDLVIAAGGDGTVTAVAGVVAGTSAALAVLPMGTGNLLARNLGLPLERERALAVAAGPGRRRIDLVSTTLGPSTIIAGFGIDAAMIRDTDERLKARFGWLSYLPGAARALRRPQRATYRIEVDDQPPATVRAVSVLVGSVGELQGGLAVLPDARPDDGLLHVIAFTPRDMGDVAGLVWRLLRRSAPSSPRTLAFTGRRVTIVVDQPVAAQIDGEYLGEHDSLAADVRPGALTVCTP